MHSPALLLLLAVAALAAAGPAAAREAPGAPVCGWRSSKECAAAAACRCFCRPQLRAVPANHPLLAPLLPGQRSLLDFPGCYAQARSFVPAGRCLRLLAVLARMRE